MSKMTIEDLMSALMGGDPLTTDEKTRVFQNYKRPDKTVYFVLQLPVGSKYFDEAPSTEPKIVTMDLWFRFGDQTPRDACDDGPFEQISVFGQNPDNYEFYSVHDDQSVYTRLQTVDELGNWLLHRTEFGQLFAQPIGFKEMNATRMEELSGEWDNEGVFDPFA